MNTQTFSIKETLSASWHLFKSNKRFIISAAAVTVVINFLLQIIQSRSEFLGGLFSLFITILISIGWAKVFLGIIHNQSVSWDTFKSDYLIWVRFIKTYLWYIIYMVGYSLVAIVVPAIITIIGLITTVDALVVIGVILGSTAFVVVAIYFGVRYQFLKFVVLESSESSSRSIFKKAGALTHGNFWKLFWFGMVLGLVNMLGFICLVVGLFATIPTTKLAQAKVYNLLKEKHSA